jgi:hypothetical protein
MTDEGPQVRIHPWLHVVPDQSGVPLGELLPVSGRTYVARVDGLGMTDMDAVFQRFWDALRLPDHFGWNWDAFSDCLRDLGRLDAEHHVLIVDNAQAILADDAAEREQFWRVVLRAGRRWSCTQRPEAVELGRLVVVASCDADSVESMTGLLQTLQPPGDEALPPTRGEGLVHVRERAERPPPAPCRRRMTARRSGHRRINDRPTRPSRDRRLGAEPDRSSHQRRSSRRARPSSSDPPSSTRSAKSRASCRYPPRIG